ncbi:hypothetical protein GA0115240_15106 [Streptomyces sp. DvalAA-14]|uniref:GNAT family N-acetyltransferase n=1 Tax=unclassified Streptomyces TaxID=2593676 RepID=UPI00081B9884|nr:MULTISPECIES: GNAT family N-acetyltransferase [unclassified Streptomyces]MYS23289.1 GNAT family N-acetyltransferase [Streptomyces sp. SID4948]SCE30934.1 hypothetical protein GA0115240_15106 [Streptomyces sp. DvalAA-14]
MTDTAGLLAGYDEQMRGAPPNLPAGVTVERHGPPVRLVGQFRGLVTGPAVLGVAGPELDALIRRQRERFAARGEAVEWKVRGHDRPVELPERLVAAGFVAEEQETVMIGEAGAMAAEPRLPAGVSLHRTTAEADLRRIAALLTAVWDTDMSWLADDLLGRIAAAPDDIAVLLARAGDQVVSAAWLVYRPGTSFAGLWGGSTVEAWRGRGIYRALVAARARLAAARGTRWLQVDASADSAPILRRLGFEPVTTTTPYVWTP